MNKFVTVLAMAAALSLASPNVRAAENDLVGQKSVSAHSQKRAKKAGLRKGKKTAANRVKRASKKKIVSHPKSPKQNTSGQAA